MALPKPRKRVIRPEPDDSQSVYFLYSAGRIKIGYTTDIMGRLANIQNMGGARVDLIAIMPGTKDFEHQLHQTFKADRVHGEWFLLSDDIRAFLRCLDEVADATVRGVIGTSIERLAFAERLFAEGRR